MRFIYCVLVCVSIIATGVVWPVERDRYMSDVGSHSYNAAECLYRVCIEHDHRCLQPHSFSSCVPYTKRLPGIAAVPYKKKPPHITAYVTCHVCRHIFPNPYLFFVIKRDSYIDVQEYQNRTKTVDHCYAINDPRTRLHRRFLYEQLRSHGIPPDSVSCLLRAIGAYCR